MRLYADVVSGVWSVSPLCRFIHSFIQFFSFCYKMRISVPGHPLPLPAAPAAVQFLLSFPPKMFAVNYAERGNCCRSFGAKLDVNSLWVCKASTRVSSGFFLRVDIKIFVTVENWYSKLPNKALGILPWHGMAGRAGRQTAGIICTGNRRINKMPISIGIREYFFNV